MKCENVQEELSAYLDGELEPGEAAALEKHLEGCAACRGELDSLRATVSLVRSLPRAEAPAALKRRVMEAAGRRGVTRRFPDALALLSAAALVLVGVVAIFMLSPRETPPAEVTANGLMPKESLDRELEECDEAASGEFAKKGWSAKGAEGAMPPAATPAARRSARNYDKKQESHEAQRQFKSKEAGRRASRIARYIAKYMTKETLEEFNKKRYSCSRGASAGLEAESMWLAAKTRGEAMYELATLFGLDLRPENFWPAPSGRLF